MAGTTVAGLEVELAQARKELRYEIAVAACAAALLADDSTEGVGSAIQALLRASDADRLFVAENVEDPAEGLCTRLVRVVNKRGVDVGAGRWQLVPWSRLPDAWPLLADGKPFVFRVEDLGPTHRVAYAGTDVRSGAAPHLPRGPLARCRRVRRSSREPHRLVGQRVGPARQGRRALRPAVGAAAAAAAAGGLGGARPEATRLRARPRRVLASPPRRLGRQGPRNVFELSLPAPGVGAS